MEEKEVMSPVDVGELTETILKKYSFIGLKPIHYVVVLLTGVLLFMILLYSLL